MPDILQLNDLFTVLDSDTRAAKGVVTPSTITLAGNQDLISILGRYAQVKAKYDATGTNIIPLGIVLGDTNGFRYQLKADGDPSVNPESDTNVNPETGVGDNWINLEISFANNFVDFTPLNRNTFVQSNPGAVTDIELESVGGNLPITEYKNGDLFFVSAITRLLGEPAYTLAVDGLDAKNIVSLSLSSIRAQELGYAFMYREDSDDFIHIFSEPDRTESNRQTFPLELTTNIENITVFNPTLSGNTENGSLITTTILNFAAGSGDGRQVTIETRGKYNCLVQVLSNTNGESYQYILDDDGSLDFNLAQFSMAASSESTVLITGYIDPRFNEFIKAGVDGVGTSEVTITGSASHIATEREQNVTS